MTLIYDIGLHNGADTRHYLKEGCRVIAVDANPVMCAGAIAEFPAQNNSGQLTVLNYGVAEQSSKLLEFWICDDVTEWSSFHRRLASRNGSRHHSIQVDCLAIQDIITRFGVPDYMKIDIEGNDECCLYGLNKDTRPRYISVEMGHPTGDRQIQYLYSLGYRRFKVICQNNGWNQVTRNNLWLYNSGPKAPWVPLWQKVDRIFRLATGRRRILAGRHLGESGPWGERTHGFWHSLDHALHVWRALRDIDKRRGTRGIGWWFDIHATT